MNTVADETAGAPTPRSRRRFRFRWSRVIAYGLLPGLALVLASAAGLVKWQESGARDNWTARARFF
jgi:Mce-associated membrane protein